MNKQRGFTLIELMVSLLVFSLVVTGILAVAVSMTNGYREQRDATSAEGMVRVPIDFIGDVLRQASPAVPGFNIQDSDTCSASALTVIDNYKPNSDLLDVVYAQGGVVTALKTVLNAGDSSINVVDITGFANGDYVVISNVTQGVIYKITGNPTGNSLPISTHCGTLAVPSGGFQPGSIAVRAQHASFWVENLTTDGVGAPVLFMDGDSLATTGYTGIAKQPLADYIEAFQVSVGIDTDANGALAAEAAGTPNGDEWLFNNSLDTAPLIDSTTHLWAAPPANIRAVRISMVARAPTADVGAANGYSKPALEDMLQGAADNYRRRILKTTIEFRNVGASP